jgi:hypothetical protein
VNIALILRAVGAAATAAAEALTTGIEAGSSVETQPTPLCLECGAPISQRRGGQPRKYCSVQCRQQQAHLRKVAKNAKPLPTCRKCGAAIERRPDQRGRLPAFCDDCRPAPKPRQQIDLDPEPLPDQRDRPFSMANVEDEWLRETLRPPPLPIETPPH